MKIIGEVGEQAGRNINSSGDVKGDGLNDIVISAASADFNGQNSGATYVVFGKSDGVSVDLANIRQPTLENPFSEKVSVVINGIEIVADLSAYSTENSNNYSDAYLALISAINTNNDLVLLGYSATLALDGQSIEVQRSHRNVTYSVDFSLKSGTNVKTAIEKLDTALQTINSQRAELGSLSNRLDHIIANNTNASTNTKASLGRIQDADFAAETTKLAKSKILEQSSTAMLAQANASVYEVLTLIPD